MTWTQPPLRADGTKQLLDGINKYRSSLNLSTLIDNNHAACLADEFAEKLKSQPCTNTTGSNTIPGTEEQFAEYPEFLKNCHLNVALTRDSSTLPACVPGLDASLVLSNFTKSQYNDDLNNTGFVSAGISSEGDWIVVVLLKSDVKSDDLDFSRSRNVVIGSIWSAFLALFLSLLVWFWGLLFIAILLLLLLFLSFGLQNIQPRAQGFINCNWLV